MAPIAMDGEEHRPYFGSEGLSSAQAYRCRHQTTSPSYRSYMTSGTLALSTSTAWHGKTSRTISRTGSLIRDSTSSVRPFSTEHVHIYRVIDDRIAEHW